MATVDTTTTSALTVDNDLERIVELLTILQESEFVLRLEWRKELVQDKQMEENQQDSHLPKDKIVMLKDVINSSFFNSVKEVYKDVYESVEEGGDDETRATLTAKATVAAFAASEGHSHPRLVELEKTELGLGFNVMGGKEQKCPIYISRIIPNGYADQHGGLRRGDQLISVNGENVEDANHERAVHLLKTAQGKISLVVRYSPSVLEEMEKRFERTKSFHSSKSKSSRNH